MDMLFFLPSWDNRGLLGPCFPSSTAPHPVHIEKTRSPGGTFHLQTTPESPQGVRRFLDLVRDGFFRDQVSWAIQNAAGAAGE